MTTPPSALDTHAAFWQHWQPNTQATLCLIQRAEQLLMIEKKRGLGAGYYTFVGGKLEANESAEQASIRETEEEIGLSLQRQHRLGCLDFQFTNGLAMRCFVFVCQHYSGQPAESAEAKPVWFSAAELPYDNMWQDDRYWLPLALQGVPFHAQMLFEQNHLRSMRLWRTTSKTLEAIETRG